MKFYVKGILIIVLCLYNCKCQLEVNEDNFLINSDTLEEKSVEVEENFDNKISYKPKYNMAIILSILAFSSGFLIAIFFLFIALIYNKYI